MVNKILIRKSLVFIISFLFIIIPIISFAQLVDPLGNTSITNIVAKLMKIVIDIGSVVAVLAFIYVGYLFVEARGNTSKLDKAKENLRYTVIGVAILLGASIIANTITTTVTNIK
jgi:hypothetical protein